ncbi:MAG: serine/threonine protein kinase [Myxococcales bacterium]|nr:serine/threonine protein kinase [Myxococcales bacterium]
MDEQKKPDPRQAETVEVAPSDPYAATISATALAGARRASSAVTQAAPIVNVQPTLSFAPEADARFVARYDVRQRLGAGGMGEVRLVNDAATGRDVAMKMMHAGERDGWSQGRARFLREARVQAQLEHPAIVPVYDIGADPEGREYFTMKRIGGRTLSFVLDALGRGKQETLDEYPLNKLLGIFRQVCLAVEYAHRRGVVHRDLKPDNIMLGELGEVYVLDWGLAMVRDLDDDPMPTTTSPVVRHVPQGVSVAGSVMGTPGYMAPEQAMGQGTLDQRSDVYSLGAILFEILTLEPFIQGQGTKQLIESSIRGSDAAARMADKNVPPELTGLCAAATRRAREERLESAQALADGIQDYLDGDRDAELRMRLADQHILAAEGAAERARTNDGDPIAERRRAMQEAGRALALDPTSARAAAVMMRMLLEPPPVLPPEVEAEVAREETAEARATARQGIGTYFANGAVAVVAAFILGLRDVRWLAAIVIPQWLASAMCVYVAKRERIVAGHVLVIGFFGFAAIAADSGIAGPLILVPAYAAAHVIILSMARTGKYRWVILAMGILSVAIPVALEYTGWITPAYEFVADGIHIRPRFVELPPLALPLGAAAAVATAVIGPAFVGYRQSDVVRRLRRQQHLQAWMLRQLAPEARVVDAAEAAAPHSR